MRLPSLKFLKTFQLAAKLGSFKDAAEQMSITASAVSHQIKALEEYLGLALFERGTRSLALTDAGAHYLEQINDTFSRLESVTDQLRLRFGRSIIRMNVPSFFANQMLLPQLASFTQEHARTDIRIETSPGGAERAHPPEADLSIVVGSGPWAGLLVHELFPQSFIAACAPAYLLEHPIDSFADLDGQTLLVQEDRRDAWDRWAESLALPRPQPNRVVRLDTMSAVARAAEQGLGIALVPARLSAERLRSGALVQLFEGEMTSNENYVLLQRHEDAKRAELQELTRWILEKCRCA